METLRIKTKIGGIFTFRLDGKVLQRCVSIMKIALNRLFKSAKKSNSKGFTMVEMLFAFSIFCLVASLLPLFFNIIFHSQSIDARVQKMEWELFISQLKKEVQASDNVEVVNGELVLVNGGEIATYQKYREAIRKQVNGLGHEIVLQNVKSVRYEKTRTRLEINVENLFGKTNKANIYPFITDE